LESLEIYAASVEGTNTRVEKGAVSGSILAVEWNDQGSKKKVFELKNRCSEVLKEIE
jgi:hypothetical protein